MADGNHFPDKADSYKMQLRTAVAELTQLDPHLFEQADDREGGVLDHHRSLQQLETQSNTAKVLQARKEANVDDHLKTE